MKRLDIAGESPLSEARLPFPDTLMCGEGIEQSVTISFSGSFYGAPRAATVSGNCSAVTETQLRHAMAHGSEGVAVDARALAEPGGSEAARAAAIAKALAALGAGRSVVVYSALGRDAGFVENQGPGAIAFNRNLGEHLGATLHELVNRERLTRALTAGGDTSGPGGPPDPAGSAGAGRLLNSGNSPDYQAF